MKDRKLLSIVIPAFNEADVLPEFQRRLTAVTTALPLECEIVYVNDGSTDGTPSVLRALRQRDDRIAIIELSRNFGKDLAMTAGIDHARGDAVVVIDADLQDPPELIPELVRGWQEGYDVVYAQRTERNGESLAKKLTARLFYRVIGKLAHFHIPRDTGDFRLLSRRAVEALGRLREQHRFMKGLFAWIGYPQKAVPYRRAPRHSGRSKWNYWKLWNFALEGITSFSTAPLKAATYIGALTAAFAFMYGAYIIVSTLRFGNAVAGYPSLMTVILFLGGIQLAALGVIGEYLARLFDEAKGRPLYLVSEFQPSRPAMRPRLATRQHGVRRVGA
ncbi:Glycosyltransferase involved in cell wall bisynthesis [Aromatoleum tolulyticum]|uniref:Glycosyltransferase involved in cell wall bisynthesis n=1 Tax=Aromatoleum tolulyticum TaxID=34027 RepID=A0A1N7B1C9_9RHOO|nr:glycosyltransferase family 2 protein [Aromatoleum tolulyticum]SIR45169.1 Glycosyltransferase involved in cell wall bisynthesis [Aromatoleum tolulyticum]